MRARDDKGQVLPLTAVLVILMGLSCLLLASVGRDARDQARARSAADAAALAGAVQGPTVAAALAEANGGQLVDFRADGDGATVRARVGSGDAVARAELVGGGAGPPGGGDRADVAPALRAALARAEDILGMVVPVERAGPDGLTVEVSPGIAEPLAAVGRAAGLCQPSPSEHPVGFGLCLPSRAPG
ncbi:MAG: pilus assembly protein TadG-related protein [Acidimicrobiia bacterium]